VSLTTVSIQLLGQKWKVMGKYHARQNGQGGAPDQPAKFSIFGISNVADSDLTELLVKFTKEEIAECALRAYENELAWAEREAEIRKCQQQAKEQFA
jgi:hypothetical protein